MWNMPVMPEAGGGLAGIAEPGGEPGLPGAEEGAAGGALAPSEAGIVAVPTATGEGWPAGGGEGGVAPGREGVAGG
jgi:hypothetical protein